MIDAKDISFHYSEGKQVLQNISFDLEKGKTLAIVGASGCGKSTLLRILSGILIKYEGDISIDGLTPDQYRQTGKLAFMFQEATLMPHLTVKQNIELPLRIKANTNEQKINNLIKAVGLEEYSTYLPKQLSGGMKTRVALARSFSTNPELLLLDEPFSALDIGWKSTLYVELEKLKKLHNTTIVIVTHDVQEALLLADRVFVLNRKGSFQDNKKLSTYTEEAVEFRVNNIPNFLASEAYKALNPDLQQAIILEGEREITGMRTADEILDTLNRNLGNETDEIAISNSGKITEKLRKFANVDKIHNTLVESFDKAKTKELKHTLLWEILEYKNLSDIQHQEYFNYYFKNIEAFSTLSKQWYKTQSDLLFFEKIQGRINAKSGYNQKKKWIYVCDLYAVKNLPELIPFLDEIINGKIEEANFPLAIQAANLIKAKMKNEKQDTIHIA